MLNLIPRFFDIDSGSITIDGQDVRAVTLASLRGAIALVAQEVSLFDDTVRANIAYGRFGAPWPRSRKRRGRPPPTPSSASCRRATIRSSASTASGSPAASGSESRSPAQC